MQCRKARVAVGPAGDGNGQREPAGAHRRLQGSKVEHTVPAHDDVSALLVALQVHQSARNKCGNKINSNPDEHGGGTCCTKKGVCRPKLPRGVVPLTEGSVDLHRRLGTRPEKDTALDDHAQQECQTYGRARDGGLHVATELAVDADRWVDQSIDQGETDVEGCPAGPVADVDPPVAAVGDLDGMHGSRAHKGGQHSGRWDGHLGVLHGPAALLRLVLHGDKQDDDVVDGDACHDEAPHENAGTFLIGHPVYPRAKKDGHCDAWDGCRCQSADGTWHHAGTSGQRRRHRAEKGDGRPVGGLELSCCCPAVLCWTRRPCHRCGLVEARFHGRRLA
eukprot:7387749-Prymnesium_polylepis.2